MLRDWKIATKLAAVVIGVVIAGLTFTGVLVLREMRRSILELQVENAGDRLHDDLRVARHLLDQHFPGAWHVEVGSLDGSKPIVGAARAARHAPDRQRRLYKGSAPMFDNPEVARTLAELDTLTGATYHLYPHVASAESDGVLSTADGLWTRAEPLFEGGRAIATLSASKLVQPVDYKVRTSAAELGRAVLLVGAVSAALASLLIVALTGRLLAPLMLIRDAALRVAAGDLATRAGIDSADEVGQLGEAFDTMAMRVQSLLTRIQEVGERLTRSTGGVNAALESATLSARHVTQAAGEVSTGAGETAARASEARREAAEMAAQVRLIEREVTAALQEARESDAIVEAGQAQAAQSLSASDGIRDTVRRASGVILDLDRHAGEIGSIVEVMKGIAAQTNLLALNAAIEAARAGDAGRGFAVVAAEVRALADEARRSSEHIGVLVDETRSRTASAVTMMQDVEEETRSGADSARRSDEDFRAIGAAVARLAAQVSAIGRSADVVASAVRRVNSVMEGVTGIAQQSAASTEEVASLASEQSASFAEIAREMRGLAGMVEELKMVMTARESAARPDDADTAPSLALPMPAFVAGD